MKLLSHRRKLYEVLSFVFIGISANSLSFFIFHIFVNYGYNEKLVLFFIYFFQLTLSFMLNRRFTFLSGEKLSDQVSRYFTMYILLFFFNIIILHVGVHYFSLDASLVQSVVIVIYVPTVFILQKYWVFSG